MVRFLVAFQVVQFLSTLAAFAEPSIDVLIKTGDEIDGEVLKYFNLGQSLTASNDGAVAFWGSVADGPYSAKAALAYVPAEGDGSILIVGGEPAPGLDGMVWTGGPGGNAYSDTRPHLLVADGGIVLFSAKVEPAGGGFGLDTVWLWHDGDLTMLAADGEPFPGVPARFRNTAVNGRLRLTADGVGLFPIQASDGKSESWEAIVRVMPDASTSFVTTTGELLGGVETESLSPANIDDIGGVNVRAFPSGLWRFDGGVSLILGDGANAPDAPPGTTLESTGLGSMNNSGDVAISAQLDGAVEGVAVYTTPEGVLQKYIGPGDPVVGLKGATIPSGSVPYRPVVSGEGTLAVGTLLDTSDGLEFGIIWGPPGEPEMLAADGQPAPGFDEPMVFQNGASSAVHANAGSDIVFEWDVVSVDNPYQSSSVLWLAEWPTAPTPLVIAEETQIDVDGVQRTVLGLDIHVSRSSGQDGRASILNDARQVFARALWKDDNFADVRGILRVELTGECVADCNADGQLNVFDFVCFQLAFQSGDLAADCTKDGELNVFDFVCFQQVFAAGCP